MPAAELSAIFIKKTKPAPKGKRVEYWDRGVPGLGLRVTDGGKKSFVFMRRLPDGTLKRWTLCPWIESANEDRPFGSLAFARSEARAKLALLAEKQNPDDVAAAAKAEAEAKALATAKAAEAAKQNTVAVLGELFITEYLEKQGSARYAAETAALFRRDVIEPWKDRQVGSIRKRDVRELLATVAAGTVDEESGRKVGGPVAANRRQAALSKFFAWLESQYDEDEIGLTANPVARLKRAGGKETPRERVIFNPELRLIWTAADTMGGAYGGVIKLLAILGQRRGEVGGMRREDLNLDKAEWTIPGSLTKNGKAHLVPLPSSALEIVKAQIAAVDAYAEEREADAGPFVFSTDGGKTCISGWSKFRGLLDGKVADAVQKAKKSGDKSAKVDDWHLHDLRRTFATGTAALEIPRDTIGAILNHAASGVTGKVYELHDRAKEKKAALDRWAAHLAGVVSGKPAKNVVQLRAAEG